MAKEALASFSRTMAARTSSSISARSNARECTASMRDKRSLSKLLLIEGPAGRRRIICAPFNRQRRYHVALTTDVLARLLVHGPASGSPVAGFLFADPLHRVGTLIPPVMPAAIAASFSATNFSASKIVMEVANILSASYAMTSKGLCRYPKRSKPFAYE
jgi:hypothetical protein